MSRIGKNVLHFLCKCVTVVFESLLLDIFYLLWKNLIQHRTINQIILQQYFFISCNIMHLVVKP